MKKVLTFDFEDGNGPVPAHRHVNKEGFEGGWVAETATVERNAWVSDTARVYGNAWVSEGEHSGSNNPVEETKPETKEVTPCHGLEPGPFCRNCGARIND